MHSFSGNTEFPGFSDEQLARLTADGCQQAFSELLNRYSPVIKQKAKKFHVLGLEAEDMCQEGALGLLQAAYHFSENGGAGFRTFADICIGRRLVSVFRSVQRKKRIPVDQLVSLASVEQDFLSDPESDFINRESYAGTMGQMLSALSERERSVLALHMWGYPYSEISHKLRLSLKAVDNALQRSRRKLRFLNKPNNMPR